ncbi:unnamed protein product, partial [Clonostachys chloroleuca]
MRLRRPGNFDAEDIFTKDFTIASFKSHSEPGILNNLANVHVIPSESKIEELRFLGIRAIMAREDARSDARSIATPKNKLCRKPGA